MTRLLLYVLLFLAVPCLASAESMRLDSLFRCLDEAIAGSDRAVAIRQKRIGQLKTQVADERDDNRRYTLLTRLYREYRPYRNDSALYYIGRCIDSARRRGDRRAEQHDMMQMAYQCSGSGLYAEAFDIMNRIDRESLSDEDEGMYCMVYSHLYGEVGYYTMVPLLREKYLGLAAGYGEEMMRLYPKNSEEYIKHQETHLCATGQFDRAMRLNDRWMAGVEKGSHRYALVAFYRSLIYGKKGNREMQLYWLTESALSDVRNAVMDQGSLWEVANILSGDPEQLQRSYRYISFAWKSASTFSTRMRSWQITPILSTIDTNHQAAIDNVNRELRMTVWAMALLSLALVCSLLYIIKQRNRLALAQHETKKVNVKLKNANKNLSKTNGQLSVTIAKLNETNKVKEEYIGRFMTLCSSYINRTETLRRKLTKRLRNREYAELERLINTEDRNDDELYEHFDSAFLHLFPNFVTEFNALLRPEERIIPADDRHLPTTIRIFALIRLGIDDSSKIAEFLHYSVNTIYNYRARIKKGALCHRDTFEQRVKELCADSGGRE